MSRRDRPRGGPEEAPPDPASHPPPPHGPYTDPTGSLDRDGARPGALKGGGGGGGGGGVANSASLGFPGPSYFPHWSARAARLKRRLAYPAGGTCCRKGIG